MIRKRAWDVMRAEFPVVKAEATLEEAAAVILGFRERRPDMDVAAVIDGDRHVGLLDVFDILRGLKDCALSDSLRLSVGLDDFEDTFRGECRRCLAARTAGAACRDCPVLSPHEPLFLVMDAMLAAERRWAVIMEGGRLLGLASAADILNELRRDAVARS